MPNFTYQTAESVFRGHPDKIADQISDALVDAHLKEDNRSKVACDTLVKANLVVVGGEITSQSSLNFEEIARSTVERIGYNVPDEVFSAGSFEFIQKTTGQSPAYTQQIGSQQRQEKFASDQGIIYGYAANESPTKMPLSMYIAQKIVRAIDDARYSGKFGYLRPDGKTQVTVAYDEHRKPDHIESVVVAAQHSTDVNRERVVADVTVMLGEILDPRMIRENTRFFINYLGDFVKGGPEIDCGLTGRKLLTDTYGSSARHGGGAFSGKDPGKLDRSAAYAARWIAKNVVAADLAHQCEIEITYAMGHEQPLAVKVYMNGTEKVSVAKIESAIQQTFDLRPTAIVERLSLRTFPSYKELAYGGHMGREELSPAWENTDEIQNLINYSL